MGNKISSRRLSMKTMKELQNNIYVDFSKDEIKEWYHEFSKHLPKGQTTLSRMEFIKVYNSLFDGDASAFATQVFRTFDTDRDNAVDFKEFILGLCISGSDEPSLKLRWAFKMYDIYGDGFISEDEMVQMINVSTLIKTGIIDVQKAALFSKFFFAIYICQYFNILNKNLYQQI